MSALLAQAQATFTFQGANVHLSCSSPEELLGALAKFGFAANEATPGNASTPVRSTPQGVATAPAGAPASPTTAPSAQPAAAPVVAEAGNAAAASPSPGTAAASSASSSAPAASPAVSFDELKKAFLGLSTKADGRAKCEGVLKPFGLAKLSEAKPEQYAAVLAEIQKASA